MQSINFRIQIFYINILTVEQPFYWTLGGMCCSSNSRSWFERSNVGQGRAWALKQHLLKGQLVTSSRSHANFKKTLSFYPRFFFSFFFFNFHFVFLKKNEHCKTSFFMNWNTNIISQTYLGFLYHILSIVIRDYSGSGWFANSFLKDLKLKTIFFENII